MPSFSQQINRWAEQTGQSMDRVIRDTVYQISESIAERTPVGNPQIWKVNVGKPREQWRYPPGYVGGTLRNNWFASIGSAQTTSLRGHDNGRGSDSLRDAELTSRMAPGNMYYFVNSMPYVKKIEDGGSKQAPAGMVALSILNFRSALDTAVRQNRRRR